MRTTQAVGAGCSLCNFPQPVVYADSEINPGDLRDDPHSPRLLPSTKGEWRTLGGKATHLHGGVVIRGRELLEPFWIKDSFPHLFDRLRTEELERLSRTK